MKLKDLKKGAYFTKKQIEYPNENQVWVRGDYDRASKTYSCHRFSDICDEHMMKADAKVFVDFVF